MMKIALKPALIRMLGLMKWEMVALMVGSLLLMILGSQYSSQPWHSSSGSSLLALPKELQKTPNTPASFSSAPLPEDHLPLGSNGSKQMDEYIDVKPFVTPNQPIMLASIPQESGLLSHDKLSNKPRPENFRNGMHPPIEQADNLTSIQYRMEQLEHAITSLGEHYNKYPAFEHDINPERELLGQQAESQPQNNLKQRPAEGQTNAVVNGPLSLTATSHWSSKTLLASTELFNQLEGKQFIQAKKLGEQSMVTFRQESTSMVWHLTTGEWIDGWKLIDINVNRQEATFLQPSTGSVTKHNQNHGGQEK